MALKLELRDDIKRETGDMAVTPHRMWMRTVIAPAGIPS